MKIKVDKKNKKIALNIFTQNIRNNKGMTLVEIMIVLAIIGAIAAVVGTQMIGTLDKSKVKETKLMMGKIAGAIQMYEADCSALPPNLDALYKSPGDEECSNWGPKAYLNKPAKDAWGNPFVYETDGSDFNIKSLGKGGKEGGKDFAKDIPYKEEE